MRSSASRPEATRHQTCTSEQRLVLESLTIPAVERCQGFLMITEAAQAPRFSTHDKASRYRAGSSMKCFIKAAIRAVAVRSNNRLRLLATRESSLTRQEALLVDPPERVFAVGLYAAAAGSPTDRHTVLAGLQFHSAMLWL
jgi:hypothetical protein